jgi:hypothetical protein
VVLSEKVVLKALDELAVVDQLVVAVGDAERLAVPVSVAVLVTLSLADAELVREAIPTEDNEEVAELVPVAEMVDAEALLERLAVPDADADREQGSDASISHTADT